MLNFYWMFVALVTGVYTFGLAGILLGPILIGLLKAVVDTVTAQLELAADRARGDEDVDASELEPMIRFTHVTKTYPRTGTARRATSALHVGQG